MDALKKVFRTPLFWIVNIIVILLIGGVGFGIFQYQKVTSELAKAKNAPTAQSGQLTEDRQRELITEVGSKIMLPSDEKPTVAVVSDISRLKDQQFFSSGQNGDIVLIYMNAKRAILYRPADKKIVEVAPVNLNPNQTASVAGQTTSLTPSGTPAVTKTSPAPTPTPAAAGSFAIRNGTTVVGLAQTVATQLLAKYPQAIIVERGNAGKRNYEKSLLVDVKGTKTQEIAAISAALGIPTGPLPQDEVAPAADYLLIAGNDRNK